MTRAAKGWGRKLASLLGQLLLMWAVFVVCSLALDAWRARHLQAMALPDNTFIGLNGEANLAHFAEHSLGVIYVWASWCGPCKVTTPAVGRLSRDYPVVSIALRSGDAGEVLASAPKPLRSTIMLNDPDGLLSDTLGVNVTPSVLFVRDGKVIGFTSGISSYWGLWLRAKWLAFRWS